LSGVQFIEVDIEEGVLQRDSESEDKDECQDSDTVLNIWVLILLIPDEDEYT